MAKDQIPPNMKARMNLMCDVMRLANQYHRTMFYCFDCENMYHGTKNKPEEEQPCYHCAGEDVGKEPVYVKM